MTLTPVPNHVLSMFERAVDEQVGSFVPRISSAAN